MTTPINGHKAEDSDPSSEKRQLGIHWLMLVSILLMILSAIGATRYITREVNSNVEQNNYVLGLTKHIKGEAEIISSQMLPAYQSLHTMDVAATGHHAEFELYVLDSERGSEKLIVSLEELQATFARQLTFKLGLSTDEKINLTEIIGVFEDITNEALEQSSPNRLYQLQLDSEDIFLELRLALDTIRKSLDNKVTLVTEDINADLGMAGDSVSLQKQMLSRLKSVSIWGLSLLIISMLSIMALLFLILQHRLGAVAEYAHAIADGKYAAVIKFVSTDKIGDMAESVHHMGSRMATLVKELRDQAGQAQDAKKQAMRLAYYDSLTGLPNRQHFLDKLQKSIDAAIESGTKVSVVYMDLDGFKKINDSYGHDVGDELLIAVAERLGLSIREEDHRSRSLLSSPELIPSRLGGDEFTFIIKQLNDKSEAEMIAKRVLSVLARPYTIAGRELTVTPSMGVAIFPDDASNSSQLVKRSDMAMYHAKDSGKNTIKLFTSELGERQDNWLSMERDLWDAQINDELKVYYQAKVDIASRKIIGAEALLRWQHPDLGMVAPDRFIPIAEECGAIVPIGEWVLRQVCEQLVSWQSMGLVPVPIAVNLSVKQLGSEDLVSIVGDCLQTNTVCLGNLELELTESVLMKDTSYAIKILNELSDLGIKISLDDFGTGYSSLSYLKRFPLCTLKIDRSFVSDIETDSDDAAIVEAILSLSKSMGLKVVAEGVETELQYEFLKKRGCEEAQGYLFSKPVPVEEFTELLRHSDTALLAS